MSVVQTITPNSITGMDRVQGKTVFIVTLNNAPAASLVVKGEPKLDSITHRDLEISLKWGSKLMKNVQDRQVNVKILTMPEIQVCKAKIRSRFGINSEEFANITNPDIKWVKMPYVANLSNADYNHEVIRMFGTTPALCKELHLESVEAMIPRMSEDAFWLQLGRVVAVDIFNGNSDRFDLATGTWINAGNIMFTTGAAIRIIGLDTFDPNSGHNNGNLNRGKVFPQLLILTDPAKRREFAHKCTTSVGSILAMHLKDNGGIDRIKVKYDTSIGPALSEIPVAIMPKLFVPYAPDFERGLTDGANDLKLYLQRKMREYGANVAARTMAYSAAAAHRTVAVGPPSRPGIAAPKTFPPSILERIQYLGWNV